MVKTSGEALLDALNTETFLALLGEEKAKCHHVELFKKDAHSFLLAHDFFVTMPWLSQEGRLALMVATGELIKRAANEQ